MHPRSIVMTAGSFAFVAATAACSVTVNTPPPNILQVTSSSNECSISANELTAGSITFEVSNPGIEASSFVVTAAGRDNPVGAVRDVAPGSRKEFALTLAAGSYAGRCQPGLEIPFTVR